MIVDEHSKDPRDGAVRARERGQAQHVLGSVLPRP